MDLAVLDVACHGPGQTMSGNSRLKSFNFDFKGHIEGHEHVQVNKVKQGQQKGQPQRKRQSSRYNLIYINFQI